MTSLAEKESDSPDEDWVFESVDVTPSTRLGLHKRQPKLKISSAAIRTIRNCLPKQQSYAVKQHQQQHKPHVVVKSTPRHTPTHTPPPPPPSSQSTTTKTTSSTTTMTTTTTTTTVPTTTTAGGVQSVAIVEKNLLLAEKVAPSIDYLTHEELEKMCIDMDAETLVQRLIKVYKSTEIFLRIREIESQNMTIECRLRDVLAECSDPCNFILDVLGALCHYFVTNSKNKDLSSKFRRLLTQALCSGLQKFLDMSPVKKKPPPIEEEPNLISFTEPEMPITEEVDLISFDQPPLSPTAYPEAEDAIDDDDIDLDNDSSCCDSDDDDSDDEDEDEDGKITLAELLDLPSDIASRYILTRAHQDRLLTMGMPPIMIYYAMNVYRLVNVISLGCEMESKGVDLCHNLIRHAHYNEAVSCIQKLNLFCRFPIPTIADQLLTVGQGMLLPVLVSEKPELQHELLRFIDTQLRFNYAGDLNIVPREKLASLLDGTDKTPQLSRLKERRFQKDLVSCGTKIVQDLGIKDENEYYFISLSQRYACLRWILAQRAIQQMEDQNLSIDATSNFNGLLDLICEDEPALAKLAIKELIDMGDTVAPAHFASIYHQERFYCEYNDLPLNRRLVGIVRGEQMSRHRTTLIPKKPNAHAKLEFYKLPSLIKWMMVDSEKTLLIMNDMISRSKVCGLDTEWVPSFAKPGVLKTALMQIATDAGDTVFLLDLKTIFNSGSSLLLNVTERALKHLFEDSNLIKIAYDFTGDFELLHSSMPSSKEWKVERLMDLKTIRTYTSFKDPGTLVLGGLSGVVATFLGLSLNKKQQLSNWEKRPLTEEQAHYAACDAYCLLEIYHKLLKQNHPFLKSHV